MASSSRGAVRALSVVTQPWARLGWGGCSCTAADPESDGRGQSPSRARATSGARAMGVMIDSGTSSPSHPACVPTLWFWRPLGAESE